MRLSSTTFTHSSTALFGLAVAGYAALRLAGYDTPPLPGHLALPTPPILRHEPRPLPSDDRVTPLRAGLAGTLVLRADGARPLHRDISTIVAPLTDAAAPSSLPTADTAVGADDSGSGGTAATDGSGSGSDDTVATGDPTSDPTSDPTADPTSDDSESSASTDPVDADD